MEQPSGSSFGGSGERLELVDALRGFALSAVLLVNLYSLSLTAFLPPAERAALSTAGFDSVFHRWVLPALLHHKALTLLSLLFGWGFSAHLQQESGGGARRFARRAAALAALGCAHTFLLWWGDILLTYALLAFLLLPFRKVPDRVLLGGGLFIALVLPVLLSPWMDIVTARLPKKADVLADCFAAFRGPSYGAMLRQNASFRGWVALALWSLQPFIFGRFLLGAWVARRRLLHDPAAHRPFLKTLFLVSTAFGCVATAVELGQTALRPMPWLATGVGAVVLGIVVLAAPLALASAYLSGFALLFLWPKGRRYLRVLAPFGRMALTHYLTQSVIGIAFFYGIGLGIGPRYGFAGELVVWAALFGAQVWVSNRWFQRFRLGPAEWLWRSMTYGRAQPMRR